MASKGSIERPNRLRQYRDLRGWSQQMVAEKIGTDAKRVGEWERGESLPSPYFRTKLCELFGKDAAELGLIELPSSSESHPASVMPPVYVAHPPYPLPSATRMPVDNERYPVTSSPQNILSRGETLADHQEVPVGLIHTHQAIDLLKNTSNDSSEQQLGALLALEANDLTTFIEEGWSVDEILAALRLILSVIQVQAMDKITRRTFGCKLLQYGAAAVVSGIPVLTGRHMSEEARVKLHLALSVCIGGGWKLFVTASMPQVLTVGQAQLQLLHQAYADIYPSMRPFFYSPVYRLIGAALFFQSRYPEALQAHNQAYLAALEAGDGWNMAESLAWQAGVYKACGRHSVSIQTTEAALRLLQDSHETAAIASRARLLAHWAESAALLGERSVMEEKLAASAEMLTQFEGNDEFDATTWQLYRGTCALYIGDPGGAEPYLTHAVRELKPNQLHQRASAALLLVQAHLKLGEWKEALSVARNAVPLVIANSSSLLDRGLIDVVEQFMVSLPNDAEVRNLVEDVQRYPRLQTVLRLHDVPRYLEAAL